MKLKPIQRILRAADLEAGDTVIPEYQPKGVKHKPCVAIRTKFPTSVSLDSRVVPFEIDKGDPLSLYSVVFWPGVKHIDEFKE